MYNDTTGQHSPLFGFMMDGIPIYGSLGDSGQYPTDLDECGGHIDSTHNFYHYHVAPNYTYPYLINCLRGCLNGTSLSHLSSTCTPASTQYDYSSLLNSLPSVPSFSCPSSSTSTTSSSSSLLVNIHLLFFVVAVVAVHLL